MNENLSSCPVCGKSGFSNFLETADYFLTNEPFSIQKCNDCGFKFVNPRPDIREIGRYYQSDEYISHDAEKAGLVTRLYKIARVFSIRTKFNIVNRYTSSGSILDIGCGTGEFLHYCNSKGYDVSGVEPNEKAGSFAQQVNGIPVTTALGKLDPLTCKFSCITMWHVLEHLHELNESLEQVKSLLLPGGVFIAAVPNSNSWDAAHYGKYWAAYDVPRHLYHFTESSVTILAKNHGFEIVKTVPQKLDAFYVSMLSEKYLTGKTNHVKAFFKGAWSNFMAGIATRGHSSQIFILSVKKT
jgi:2-polyprenyl-3-methyl-5-hydroxy-6-metoxy-1,4-benzoquinol methylase